MTQFDGQIRIAGPDDLDAIIRLVRTVHGERYPQINHDYFRWRYFNDAGYNASIFIAEHRGEPIGIRPVAILDYVWGDARLKGAMYTGVMTHPQHRRKGVFRSLVAAADRFAAERGAAFCMTLPNAASLSAYHRMADWVYAGAIPVFFKIIDARRVLEAKAGRWLAAIGAPPIAWCFRNRILAIDADAALETVNTVTDDLAMTTSAFARWSNTLQVHRPAQFWNWRYLAHPHIAYTVQTLSSRGSCRGIVAASITEHSNLPVGMIVDLIADDDAKSARTLIRSAESDLRARGAALITCQASTPQLQAALRAERFRRLPDRLSPKRFHFVYRLTGEDNLPAVPGHLGDWHLMFGDSDNA